MLLPGGADRSRARGTDPAGLFQARGRGLDHLQRLGPEVADEPLGRYRSHAADQARAEVLSNPLDGGRQYHRAVLRLELPSVLGVRRPAAAQAHRLPDVRRRQAPHHGDQVALAGGLQAEDGKPAVLVLERDPLDATFQGGKGRRGRTGRVARGIRRHGWQLRHVDLRYRWHCVEIITILPRSPACRALSVELESNCR